MIALVVGHSTDAPGHTSCDGVREVDAMTHLANAVGLALAQRGHAARVYHRSHIIRGYQAKMAELTQRINADRPDVVLSLHWNGGIPQSGPCALHWPGSRGGARLASYLSAAVAQATGLPSRGPVAQDRSWSKTREEGGRLYPDGPVLHILRDTRAPAVILEVCNADLPGDLEAYRRELASGRLAEAVAGALCVWLEER